MAANENDRNTARKHAPVPGQKTTAHSGTGTGQRSSDQPDSTEEPKEHGKIPHYGDEPEERDPEPDPDGNP
jgi:hypothetical protein